MTDRIDVMQLAGAQRLMIWAFLASLLSFIPVLLVVTIPFLMYSVWQVTDAMRSSTAAKAVWLLLMFIPLVSLIALLVLNGQATGRLKQHGVRVGLLGANKADLRAQS